MLLLGALNASILSAVGFGDLIAVFGNYEPVARFVMVVAGSGIGFLLSQMDTKHG